MGLAGEAGETLEVIKKHLYHNHDLDADKVAEELGDTLYYFARLAAEVGYSLEEIVLLNIQKRLARYPAGFDPERSRNRESG